MSRLPVLSGQELCKALAKVGYRIDHQTGSHIILRMENPPHRRLTVPSTRKSPKELYEPSSVKLVLLETSYSTSCKKEFWPFRYTCLCVIGVSESVKPFDD